MFWEQKCFVLRRTDRFVSLRFFPEHGFLSVCFSLESVHEVIQLTNVDIHEENLWFSKLKEKQHRTLKASSRGRGGEGESDTYCMKSTEMPVVSLRGISQGFWPHLACSWQNTTTFVWNLKNKCLMRNEFPPVSESSLLSWGMDSHRAFFVLNGMFCGVK